METMTKLTVVADDVVEFLRGRAVAYADGDEDIRQ